MAPSLAETAKTRVFDKLPEPLLQAILALTSDKHPPTATARIMNVITPEPRCDPETGTTVVWMRGGEGAFKKIRYSTASRKVWLPWGRAIFEVSPVFEPFNPRMGVVVTRTWRRLRQQYSFEDALDYMETIGSDYDITDW